MRREAPCRPEVMSVPTLLTSLKVPSRGMNAISVRPANFPPDSMTFQFKRTPRRHDFAIVPQQRGAKHQE